MELFILNTTRNKRWNGKIDTLAVDFLKEVAVQMASYGDRVQFSLNGAGQKPNYQVINSSDKKMVFNGGNHLFDSKADDFLGSNTTGILTVEQVKAAIAGVGLKASAAARSTRASSGSSSRPVTAAAKAQDLVNTEKYEYFKTNRQTLPAAIGEYSDEIATLMRNGMSAADAFGDVVKRYF